MVASHLRDYQLVAGEVHVKFVKEPASKMDIMSLVSATVMMEADDDRTQKECHDQMSQ